MVSTAKSRLNLPRGKKHLSSKERFSIKGNTQAQAPLLLVTYPCLSPFLILGGTGGGLFGVFLNCRIN